MRSMHRGAQVGKDPSPAGQSPCLRASTALVGLHGCHADRGDKLAFTGAASHLLASLSGPMGLLPMSAGEEPSATSASRLRDSFLSSPASLPAARVAKSQAGCRGPTCYNSRT